MANVGVVIDGAVLRALRKHRMWSMAQLAREARSFAKRVNENSALAAATVCRAEQDERPLSQDNLRYLVGALEPSQADLRRLLKGAEPPEALVRLCSDAPGQPAEQDPATLAATVAQLNAVVAAMRVLLSRPSLGAAAARQADDVDRFEFLHEFLPGVLGAVAVPWAAVERLSDTRHAGVDDTLVAASEDMADVLWRACSSASTERHQRLLVAVGHEAGAVRKILRRPMTDVQRRRLYEVSVGLHAEAGWLGLRLHELDVADGFFALARAAAYDSANDRLQAQALQISTHMLSSLQHGGHGGDDDLALTRVKEAAAHAAHADAHTRAETARRLAEQRALDKDDPGFRAALEQAYEEFARVDGSETGFSVRLGLLSPRWLHATAGWGHMLAKRNSEALREFRAAVRDPAMAPGGTVQLRADMARVWVQLDEPEQACAELTTALKLAAAIGYPMGMQRIRGVRVGFPKPWAELDCVREFDERLRAAAAA